MRIFVCAGEPSGDLHGANLVRALRQRRPDVECVGFGGERMEAAGCRLLYPLCRLAVMWFLRVLANAHVFLGLLSRADRFFRHHRPDAVVLIDYPGFNWWLARRARFHGIPVFYFVPPQLWAWAGWRVEKMRRFVDHVLCTLPFEKDWYEERGVPAHYVGHPYFDELTGRSLDEEFLAAQRNRPGPVVGLLPGSRTQEVERNFPTLLRAAHIVHEARPDARFLVACFKEAHRRMVSALLRGAGPPVEAHVGRTPEVIALAHACVAVSGSVGLELLYHRKPTVVVYRVGPLLWYVGNRLATCKYISLVNLLADAELFPEYPTRHCEAEAAAGHVLSWLNDPAAYADVCGRLDRLCRQVAEPGACGRAARFVLDELGRRNDFRSLPDFGSLAPRVA
jgi:lipid-A-disaccharide synthase